MCVRECVCVCARARSACVFVNSLVYSQCYHISADACQKKSSGASTTSVLLSTEHLPYKYSSHTHIHTHATHATHDCYNQIQGRRARGKKDDRQRQKGGGGRETSREREGSGEGGMAEDGESCVLNIPCLILPCPRLSSSSWPAIRGAERERASDKDKEDSLLHTHCSFTTVQKVYHSRDTCCPNR